MSSVPANIAFHLDTMAAGQPDLAALKVPRGRRSRGRIDYLTLSFSELAAEVDAWRAHLTACGVNRGDRTLVMVKPGLPLIAAVFALFKLGAIPIVIDPGMGLRAFLNAVGRSRPQALVGIPPAQLLGYFSRAAFRSVKTRVWASSSPVARRGRSKDVSIGLPAVDAAPGDTAAILFTSGSTGAPKGVVYTHGMFAAQVAMIRETYDLQPGEIDLPMLPIFALFNPALGMTTVVPEIDPSRPASVDPARIVQAIRQEEVTNSFGSPTLWRKIASYCEGQRLVLPSLRRVLSAGAPVPPDLWKRMTALLPNGELHSPYGATEALPIASITASEMLATAADATARGAGTCVGRVLPGNQVRILALVDRPIATLADARERTLGEIGEIVVAGPTVTATYDDLPEATARAKIREVKKAEFTPEPVGAAAGISPLVTRHPPPVTPTAEAVVIWHRMGDCGYLDAAGRLWFCGRKVECVVLTDTILYTEQVEPIFNAVPGVRRTALIGIGPPSARRPALVVEPVDAELVPDSARCRALARELRLVALEHAHTAAITVFYFHPAFPVDVRHNAKIHRLALAKWASTACGFQSDPKR